MSNNTQKARRRKDYLFVGGDGRMSFTTATIQYYNESQLYVPIKVT